MKSTIFSIICCMLVLSCSKSDDEDQDTTKSYSYTENARLQIPDAETDFFVVTVGQGSNLMFTYELVKKADPNLADSGYSESILFELDAALNEFSYSDEDLQQLNMYYRQICFCVNTESIAITSGTIQGQRVNQDTWEIQLNVEIDFGYDSGSVYKEVEGRFSLEK
ncbi:hypothetical protein [Croceivirga sp. JEA036]|uniref:hypothetical protein n=1 Tax=Croceivirga sp. JEA036 TaxID=2721162 RepID=UPI00143BBD9A|nr:hypothetical protein [Croceivirga sp. JEA036]NJB37779.1 hypothetical protein [Croceivirga sp. JEA036]